MPIPHDNRRTTGQVLPPSTRRRRRTKMTPACQERYASSWRSQSTRSFPRHLMVFPLMILTCCEADKSCKANSYLPKALRTSPKRYRQRDFPFVLFLANIFPIAVCLSAVLRSLARRQTTVVTSSPYHIFPSCLGRLKRREEKRMLLRFQSYRVIPEE